MIIEPSKSEVLTSGVKDFTKVCRKDSKPLQSFTKATWINRFVKQWGPHHRVKGLLQINKQDGSRLVGFTSPSKETFQQMVGKISSISFATSLRKASIPVVHARSNLLRTAEWHSLADTLEIKMALWFWGSWGGPRPLYNGMTWPPFHDNALCIPS